MQEQNLETSENAIAFSHQISILISMTKKLALSIKNLSKTYPNGKKALDSVDFSIPEGGFVALLGENGAGKSTLINIVSGLIPKSEGSIEVFGHSVDSSQELAKLSI